MKKTVRTVVIFIAIFELSLLGYYYFYSNKKPPAPPLPTLGTVPEFSLLKQDSTAFTRSNINGNITIADFIFTTCGGPCPLMTSKMTELQDTLSNASKVHFLSFSVDPEYDTPSILTAYAQGHHANLARWNFLTGDKHVIYGLARYGFHLTADDEGSAIIHSTKFILIDDKGAIRGYYDYDDSTAIPKLIADARTLAVE